MDPWNIGFEIPAPEAEKDVWKRFNALVGEKNAKAIESSDGVLVVLDGTDVDSGTASEIGCAFALGKKILGYRGDFRLTGDNPGSTVNLQVEYFIRKSGGTIVRSIEELADTLGDVFSGLEGSDPEPASFDNPARFCNLDSPRLKTQR